HIFLKFKKANSAKIKEMIQQLALATFSFPSTQHSFHYLSSAKEQLFIRKLIKEAPANAAYKASYSLNLYLSNKGYEALGFSGNQLPSDRSFQHGLGAFLKRLQDQGKLTDITNEWDLTFSEIHAMIAIAHEQKIVVRDKTVVLDDAALQKLIDAFQPYVLNIETGKVLYNSDDPDTNEPIEHFGFRDGLSNPVFFMEDWEKKRMDDINGKVDQFNPAASLQLALAEDPNCKQSDHAFGSYLVFGKLEQNVWAFEQDIEKLANMLQGTDLNERKDRARALVMGRFRDGTPITLQGTEGGISNTDGTIASSPNNFLYSNDQWGFEG